MNIFKKIKRLFTNEVSLETIPSEIITPYKLKGDKFKIGAKIIVPKDLVLVVTLNNKVMEIINEGEYQVSSALMPNVAKKLKLDKYDKYGKQKDSFYAGAYFVRANQPFIVNFSNYRKLKYTQGFKSYFKISFCGKIECKITSVNKFFGLMLNNFASVKSDTAQYFLELLINESLTDKLDKATYSKQDYQEKSEPLLSYISEKIKSLTSSVGVESQNVEIDFVVKEKLPKEKKPQLTKEEKKVEKQLGDEVIENIEISQNVDDGEVCMYDDETPKTKNKSGKFVDLSLDSLYDDNETKICPNCGEKNRLDALICYKCGTKFMEE